jgi:hypothetical protein
LLPVAALVVNAHLGLSWWPWELQGLVCILCGPPRSSSLVFFLLARYVSMLPTHPTSAQGFGHGIWLYQYRFLNWAVTAVRVWCCCFT